MCRLIAVIVMCTVLLCFDNINSGVTIYKKSFSMPIFDHSNDVIIIHYTLVKSVVNTAHLTNQPQ